MTTATLNKIKLLPASKQQEVEDFINFLARKYLSAPNQSHLLGEQRLKNMGRYKGKIKITEDFNDTPADFQDYI